jgi:hypothetical protein
MGQENEIVFEDLHGLNEEQPVEVDLDAATKDDGISLAPTEQVVDDVAVDDDSVEFSGLRDADASPAPLEDDAASTGSEDDDYSKKVKARIQRATRGEKKAKKEADYWKGQAENLAKQQSVQGKETLENRVEQAKGKIESTLTQLDAAIEGGNTKEQVRLTNDLTDLKAEQIQSEILLGDLSESGNLQPFSDKVTDTSTDQSLADKWTEERSDWYKRDGFERQTRVANRIDREVFQDGYDPKTPEYFEELDRRMKEKEPTLFDDAADDDGTTTKRQRPKRSPVAPIGGADGGRQRSKSSKIKLGEQDFANMRRFGLNPNDPEVLKEYARNKRETLQGANS